MMVGKRQAKNLSHSSLVARKIQTLTQGVKVLSPWISFIRDMFEGLRLSDKERQSLELQLECGCKWSAKEQGQVLMGEICLQSTSSSSTPN